MAANAYSIGNWFEKGRMDEWVEHDFASLSEAHFGVTRIRHD